MLFNLNSIFNTRFPCTAGVEACLAGFIDDGCDFGQVYGHLRPWWPRDVREFDTLPARMRDRRQKDFDLRAAAVSSNRIKNPRIPPRRVWDLYANRVLPYYVLSPHPSGDHWLPDNLWAVSHSWCATSSRTSVLTTINGKSWHVPIPRGTTLNKIREELLILGAEYVFLDVLCLRQKDELLPEFEGVRKREWKLDIPTIGHIFNESMWRPVIVYFNGLGLPFSDSPVDPNDQFHWFNRVWTLQETPNVALIGGLEHKLGKIMLSSSGYRPPGISEDFLRLFNCSKLDLTDIQTALQHIKSRAYSNPVDQVACLAYLLECPTLPIYDADMDVEVAWSMLVECLPEFERSRLLFSDFGPRNPSGSWRPTWKQVMNCTRFRPAFGFDKHGDDRGKLMHLDGSSPHVGYKHGFDAYYHTVYSIRNCRIHISQGSSDEKSRCSVEIPLKGAAECCSIEATEWGESILPGSTYHLISTGWLKYWIVAQVEGMRCINGERALQVSKISTLIIPDSYSPIWIPREEQFIEKLDGSYQLVVWR